MPLPGGAHVPSKPFIFYFSLMIDAYETTTYCRAVVVVVVVVVVDSLIKTMTNA